MFGGAVVLLAVASLVRGPLRLRWPRRDRGLISLTAFGLGLWQWADLRPTGPTRRRPRGGGGRVSVLVTVLVPRPWRSRRWWPTATSGGKGSRGQSSTCWPRLGVGGHADGAANDLIVMFLGLEILSIALYVLTAFNHRRAASGEGALKYFILGGVLLGDLRLRHRPHLRRHRVDQPDPDRRLPLQERGHLDGLLLAGLPSCWSGSPSRSPPCRSTCGPPTSTRAPPRR